jgi:hypothetical protein
VHRLGAVAVGVEQEAAVVVGAVLRARPGLAVGRVAGLDGRLPALVDALLRGCDERDVQPLRQGVLVVRLGQREVVPLRERPGAIRPVDPEDGQHRVVEALGRVPVADADRDVVEHGRRELMRQAV